MERLASDAGLPQVRLQTLEAQRWAPVENRVARGLIEVLDCDFDDLFVIVDGPSNGK
jgi:hypothetical protein